MCAKLYTKTCQTTSDLDYKKGYTLERNELEFDFAKCIDLRVEIREKLIRSLQRTSFEVSPTILEEPISITEWFANF